MRSSRATFPSNSTDGLRRATEERTQQGMASAKKDESNVQTTIKREREPSPEGLFIAQDQEPETTTPVASTTLSSGPYAGLRSAKKRVHQDVEPEKSAASSFGPPKKVAKKGEGLRNIQTIDSRTTQKGPDWYQNVDPKQVYARGDLQNLKYFFTLVEGAKKHAETQSFDRIRQRLQQMEFHGSLSPILVKQSGLLGEDGLPMVFENRVRGVYFSKDIRADADILYRKWMTGQVDPHLFRGIVTKTGTGKQDRGFKSHSIDPGYPGKVSCNYVGAGNLVNGQWWPLQLCAKRDGAHGEVEAGIHGQKTEGAYSVVVSGGGYQNIDNGDSVKYCGTQGSLNLPSAGTTLLLKSYEKQQSLRLLRSASLPASNQYRPARGLRYDGLYLITDFEVLDEETAMHRFFLSRVDEQDPIRYNGAGMIPSNAQIVELNKIRERIG